jgi:hypothetical protein
MTLGSEENYITAADKLCEGRASTGVDQRRDGNPTGRHRGVVGWAERARWAGREAEAQWGGGEKAGGKEKKMGRG